MAGLIRVVRGVVPALALVLVVSAPVAAAEPTRTVFDLTGTTTFSADESGCGFAVSASYAPRSRATVTDFSDGTEVYMEHSVSTLTANSKTFVKRNFYYDVATVDASGVMHGVEYGQSTWSFLPGDIGPYGLVGAPGLGLHFDGTVRYTYDLNIGAITEFAYTGKITDVCALLS
jgi:hypothetical protein